MEYETHAIGGLRWPGRVGRDSEQVYLEFLARRVRDRRIESDVCAAEQKVIAAVLEETAGDVTESARRLKMSRLQLHRLIKRYGVDVSKYRRPNEPDK